LILDHAVNIDDLRIAARRRLPRFIFDMIEGGVEEEIGVLENEASFRRVKVLPSLLNDITVRDQTTTLFGRTYASPFGIAPMGPAPLYRRNGDLLLAGAAVQADIPFVLSGAGGASVEQIAKVAPDHAWFQLYGAADRSITHDIIRRTVDSGLGVMVFTVDTPVSPKRERHLRNRITLPLRKDIRNLAVLGMEGVFHPAWALDYLASGGMPMMGTWAPYAKPGSTPQQVAEFFRSQSPSNQTWKDLEDVRRRWPGRLLVKGVLNPTDAVRMVDMGVDGVIVSSHGGKIVDRAPSPLAALPGIKAAVGDRAAVLMDGGVRRGVDVAIARCLGADFILAGRPMLYGLAAAGGPGAARAIDLLRTELDLILATVGCSKFDDLSRRNLYQPAALSEN